MTADKKIELLEKIVRTLMDIIEYQLPTDVHYSILHQFRSELDADRAESER